MSLERALTQRTPYDPYRPKNVEERIRRLKKLIPLTKDQLYEMEKELLVLEQGKPVKKKQKPENPYLSKL